MYISLRNPWDYPNKRFPGSKRNPGNARGTDRNRRATTSLSPILYLFLEPSGKLYQKVQHALAEDEKATGGPLPIIPYRRLGPKHPAYGIPPSQWPTVLHRVLEKKEPLRKVGDDYGVSHETIRRMVRAVRKMQAG